MKINFFNRFFSSFIAKERADLVSLSPREVRNRFSVKYFENRENRRRFLEDFAKHVGISSLEDFYLYRTQDLLSFAGSVLFKHYYDHNLKVMHFMFYLTQ